MDCQRNIVLASKKVKKGSDSLTSSLDKRNVRLTQKYVTQLQDSLDEMMQALVTAEIEGVSDEEPWLVEAKRLEDLGQTTLLNAEEYLIENENSEVVSATERVNEANLIDLVSSINSFKESLKSPAQDLVVDVEDSRKSKVIKEIITQKKEHLVSFKKQKIELASTVSSDSLTDKMASLDDLYNSVNVMLNDWVECAVKHFGYVENTVSNKSCKGPGLKLDRLALPVFRGNVRNFARFIKEFENTVGVEFSDPKIKGMYLQNQCLSGPAKELVRNLITYEDVMMRLKERYGKVSTVIDTVLKDIEELKLSAEEPVAIMNLSRCLEMAWDDMSAVNAVDEFCNIVTLRTIEGKLPRRLQTLWAQEKSEANFESSKNTMNSLKVFIERHRKVADEVIAMRGKSIDSGKPIISGKPNVFRPKYPEKKDKLVNAVNVESNKRACFRCGFFNHLVKECKVPATIKCRRCQKVGHIENACKETPPQSAAKQQSKENESGGKKIGPNTVGNVGSSGKTFVRLPIETVGTEYGPCLALWDSGSMINLVSKQWATQNNLRGKDCDLEYKVVDSESRKFATKIYDIQLMSRSGLRKTIRAYELESLAASICKLSTKVLGEVVKELNIDLEDIGNPSGNIQLLLGGQLMIHFPTVIHQIGELCVMSSDFGLREYFIVGFQKGCWRSTGVNVICNVVDKFLTDFFSVEEIGVRPPPICKTCKSCEICKPAAQFMSLKEHMELSVIKSKLTYDKEEQVWTADYPYNKDPSVLKDNYQPAFDVLKRRENKLLKDESLRTLYSEQVTDFVNRGVLKKMTEKDLQDWTGPVRYVDHREVFKENSTTPVRIVINSSFKKGNELSLNDILMKGPNVLSSLFDILTRWRLYPVAFAGDISKMYHNVRTGTMEANLRRLLWRDCNQKRPPDIYSFQTVTFGDRPAGCIVVSALRETASMFADVSERAAYVLQNDSYMDDVLSGEDNMELAKKLVTNVEKIAEKGSFKFKKFVFSGEFLENGEKQPTEKVLGVNWEPSEDIIKIGIELNHHKKKRGHRTEPATLEEIPYTRRICLRLVNSIFDPLGLVSPVTVRLKILMKEHFVIQDKYKKWDTLLEEDDRLEWIKVLRDIQELKQISVPRYCINVPAEVLNETGKYSLICFTDASKSAMCAAVYVRFQSVSGHVSVGLLVAKTRVSPVKLETIPKLELCAALLGARLVSKVTSALTQTIVALYFLIDSTIVLGSLSKGSLASDFSGSCIAEIRGKTKSAIFGWIQSEDNIADIGSRGVTPDKIDENSEWQRGPAWLCEPMEDWPVEIVHLEDLPVVGNIQVSDQVIKIEKFSDLFRLHKHTALCLKFVRSKGNGKSIIDCDWRKVKLTPEDYRCAEEYWVKKVSEHVLLLYNSGKLQSLRPSMVWDERGQFLKVVTSGRLGKLLKIGYDVEELTILDPKHPYTRLVLKDCHDKDHGGDDRAVWKSRTKFWIPQARREVKKIRKECFRCRILNKRNVQQLMAPLPSTRVLPTPAWTYTSLDLFGPLEHVDMVRKRMKEKCWGVLFTCMVSRAVHLDLTQAYDTDALLQAVRRFMSLRGSPKEFLSDQGSQLVACSKEVEMMLEVINWNMVEGWCSRKGITWKFVPPQGQHMNGVAESLIRVTKHHLKQTLEGKRLTFVETQTVLCEVSQAMNCRPLGIFSRPGADPLDGGPITPNHLLLDRATGSIPDLKFGNVSNVKRMKFLNSVVVEFWEKWRMKAFDSLVPQYKWHKTQRNIEIGDVVLLKDDESKVSEFKLGQVQEVKVSTDGLVRSVKVRTVSRNDAQIKVSYLDRPVHKLCVIVPIEEQE